MGGRATHAVPLHPATRRLEPSQRLRPVGGARCGGPSDLDGRAFPRNRLSCCAWRRLTTSRVSVWGDEHTSRAPGVYCAASHGASGEPGRPVAPDLPCPDGSVHHVTRAAWPAGLGETFLQRPAARAALELSLLDDTRDRPPRLGYSLAVRPRCPAVRGELASPRAGDRPPAWPALGCGLWSGCRAVPAGALPLGSDRGGARQTRYRRRRRDVPDRSCECHSGP